MDDNDKMNRAMNEAPFISMDGAKFRAMVAALIQAAPNMLHGHVRVISAAVESAAPLFPSEQTPEQSKEE